MGIIETILGIIGGVIGLIVGLIGGVFGLVVGILGTVFGLLVVGVVILLLPLGLLFLIF
ncbi:MAG TPA: hypothetical protein VHO48_04335 [Anaerolineaceae bacterium]|nr:hypothetical protein [Anaerolineaceae bacterium]